MAKLEITVSNKTSRSLVAHEEFEISLELAQELIKRMEAMVAKLPGHHRTTRTVRPDSTTIVEIELNRDLPPPTVQPDFEELFRSGGRADVRR